MQTLTARPDSDALHLRERKFVEKDGGILIKSTVVSTQ